MEHGALPVRTGAFYIEILLGASFVQTRKRAEGQANVLDKPSLIGSFQILTDWAIHT